LLRRRRSHDFVGVFGYPASASVVPLSTRKMLHLLAWSWQPRGIVRLHCVTRAHVKEAMGALEVMAARSQAARATAVVPVGRMEEAAGVSYEPH